MKIIDDLKTYRLKNRLSQVKLAQELGVHFITIIRWEKGRAKPNAIQTFHIEALLKKDGGK
jgi:DNA-binding XRE family transcriptional regulator